MDKEKIEEERSMAKRLDLTGQRFGLLTVIRVSGKRRGKTSWLCRCDCGNEKDGVITHDLVGGVVRSCGCMYSKRRDLSGQRFARLRVLGDSGKRQCGKILWRCLCDCGKEHLVVGQDLLQGKVQSCGCLHNQIVVARNKERATHKNTRTRLYRIWVGMKIRCYDSNDHGFKHYGARGIVLCDEWKNDFVSFKRWAESSGYNENLTIERIDVNGNYSPSNCTWIPMKEQAKNKQCTLRYNGRPLVDIARELRFDAKKVYRRVTALNWPVEEALEMVPHRRSHELFVKSKAFKYYNRRKEHVAQAD